MDFGNDLNLNAFSLSYFFVCACVGNKKENKTAPV